MDELIAFLKARLDETEAVARASSAHSPAGQWARDADEVGTGYDIEFARIVRHDPARVLREVAAKRAVIKGAALLARVPPNRAVGLIAQDMLRHLAAAWSGHPDYCAEWKP